MTHETPDDDAPPAAAAPTPLAEREVRALPVVAVCAVLLTITAIVFLGRNAQQRGNLPVTVARRGAEPAAVRDTDSYTPGSPAGVAERFLRAWMRARYEEARDLATGEMRTRAEHEVAEVGAFNAAQMEEYRRTRAFVEATHVDLEHIQLRDLPPGPGGRARKEVRGQAHSYANFNGTHVDSRRGQTFVLEMVDGAWRVAERTWETFER